jgi:HK97 family phage prohead protease
MSEEKTAAIPDAIEYRDEQCLMTCEVKADDAASRVRRFVGSTAVRDRCGDEITVEGWDTKNYTKNPVFLWAHNYGELPIGKAVNVERTDKALVFDVEFAPAEANPKAEQVLKLYDGGYLRAVSVGFRSKASEWIDRNEEEEAKRAKKEPDAPIGRRFTKVELLELSAVPVPANPDALMTARRKGLEIPDAKNVFYVRLDAPAQTKDIASDTAARDVAAASEATQDAAPAAPTTAAAPVEEARCERETPATGGTVAPVTQPSAEEKATEEAELEYADALIAELAKRLTDIERAIECLTR